MRHRNASIAACALTASTAFALSFATTATAAESRLIPRHERGTSSQVAKGLSDALPVRAVRPLAPGDEVVDGRGDSSGWHIYAASSGDGWAWRPLATLAPAGLNVDGQR